MRCRSTQYADIGQLLHQTPELVNAHIANQKGCSQSLLVTFVCCAGKAAWKEMVSLFKFASGRADDLFGCLLARFSAVSSVADANPELVRI